MICENYMNFKCQCPQIKLYWNAATYIRLYHLCLRSCSDGRVEPCERGLWPTKPKIFKSGPFQKKFADPRWTVSGKLHKTWTMAAASGEGISKGHKQKGDFLQCNFLNFWIIWASSESAWVYGPWSPSGLSRSGKPLPHLWPSSKLSSQTQEPT